MSALFSDWESHPLTPKGWRRTAVTLEQELMMRLWVNQHLALIEPGFEMGGNVAVQEIRPHRGPGGVELEVSWRLRNDGGRPGPVTVSMVRMVHPPPWWPSATGG